MFFRLFLMGKCVTHTHQPTKQYQMAPSRILAGCVHLGVCSSGKMDRFDIWQYCPNKPGQYGANDSMSYYLIHNSFYFFINKIRLEL